MQFTSSHIILLRRFEHYLLACLLAYPVAVLGSTCTAITAHMLAAGSAIAAF